MMKNLLSKALFWVLVTLASLGSFGLRGLRRVQISNPEDTPGTAEAATEILYFTEFEINQADEVWSYPEQDRGSLAMRIEKPILQKREVEISADGELYDRMMVFLGSMAVRGNVTPTQPDSGTQPNAYEWLFEPALGTPNTPDETNGIDTFTIEYGDNVQGYEVEYLFLTELEISGVVDENVTFSATFMGRQVSEVTFTGSLTEETVKYFPFNKTKFYIEGDSYANIGTTQKTGMLRGFTWTFETGFTPRFAADGGYVFSGLNEARKSVELSFTYYRDDTNEAAEFDAFSGTTNDVRYMRIALESEGEMDSGQSNPEYIYLDGAFHYEEYPTVSDEDGTSIVEVTARSYEDLTEGKMFGITVGTTMDAFNA